MGLNTQFPSWLQDQNQLNAQVGMQLGRNFMEGMKMAEEKRLNEAKMAEMRRMNDIQIDQAKAQIAMQEAQTQTIINKNNFDALSAQGDATLTGKMADFVAMQQGLYKLEGGLSNPEARIQSLDFVRKYPQVAYTKQWADLNRDIDTAEKAARELEKVKQASIIRYEAIANKPTTAIQNAEALADTAVKQSGLDRNSPEGQRLFLETKSNALQQQVIKPSAQNKPTKVQQRIDEIVSQDILSGKYQKGSKEEQDARDKYNRLGGKAEKTLEAKPFETLNAQDLIITSGEKWLEDAKDFETEYGKDALKKYIGPVDKPVNEVLDQLRERTDPESKDALKLMSSFERIFNISSYQTGGKTLTQQEIKRKLAELGSRVNQNLVQTFDNWINNNKNEFKTSVENYAAGDYKIIPKWLRRAGLSAYQGINPNAQQAPAQMQQSAPAQQSTNTFSLPGGWEVKY